MLAAAVEWISCGFTTRGYVDQVGCWCQKNRMLSGVEDEESVERATNAEQLKRGKIFIILELYPHSPGVARGVQT